MKSIVKASCEHKDRMNTVLRDPENVKTIKRVYKNIILKKFSIHQARFGARKVAIRLCQASNVYTCNKNNCDSCIGYNDIVQIVE